jgi:hypothetical protein
MARRAPQGGANMNPTQSGWLRILKRSIVAGDAVILKLA